jgi:hypothetical protein
MANDTTKEGLATVMATVGTHETRLVVPLDQLAAQLAEAPALALISAPPGFGKTRLLDAASKRPGRKVSVFGRTQHRLAPAGAAEAILKAGPEETVAIDGLQGADTGAIAEAVVARFASADAPRIWIVTHHLKELAVARFLADGTAQIFDWRCLKMTDSEVRARTDRIPMRFRKVVAELGAGWPAAVALLCRHPDDFGPRRVHRTGSRSPPCDGRV